MKQNVCQVLAKSAFLIAFCPNLFFLLGKHIRNLGAVCNWCLRLVNSMGLCSINETISENQVRWDFAVLMKLLVKTK